MFKKNSTTYKILAISLSVVITASIGFIITRAGSLNPSGAPGSTMHDLNALAGSGFSSSTDSLEAIRNQGDASWTTASGFSTHDAADVWTSGTRTLTDPIGDATAANQTTIINQTDTTYAYCVSSGFSHSTTYGCDDARCPPGYDKIGCWYHAAIHSFVLPTGSSHGPTSVLCCMPR